MPWTEYVKAGLMFSLGRLLCSLIFLFCIAAVALAVALWNGYQISKNK